MPIQTGSPNVAPPSAEVIGVGARAVDGAVGRARPSVQQRAGDHDDVLAAGQVDPRPAEVLVERRRRRNGPLAAGQARRPRCGRRGSSGSSRCCRPRRRPRRRASVPEAVDGDAAGLLPAVVTSERLGRPAGAAAASAVEQGERQRRRSRDMAIRSTRQRPKLRCRRPGSRRQNPLLASPAVTTVADLPLIASGKVREMYDLGDRLLMVASDRISTYDVVHPNPIPDKGKVLTGLSAFWFARTEHIVPNHLVSATDGVPDEVRGRAIVATQAADAPGRVRRARLHHRLGLEGLPGDRQGLGHRAARRACRSPRSSPSRSSRRRRRPRSAPRRDDRLRRRPPTAIGDATLPRRLRDVSIALYSFAADHAAERGVILADTKFEFGLDDDGELVVGDEVLTPGLLALLAGRRLRGRPRPAELRQAVRPRLGVAAPAGTSRRRRPRSPPRSSTARARATSRPTRRSPASRSQAWLDRTAP